MEGTDGLRPVFEYILSEDWRGPTTKTPWIQAEKELFGRALRNDDSWLNVPWLKVKDSPSDTSLVSTAVNVTRLSILLNRDPFSATPSRMEQFSFSWCLIKIKANSLRPALVFFSWESVFKQRDGTCGKDKILTNSHLQQPESQSGQTGVGVMGVSDNRQKSTTMSKWQAAVDY